MKLLNKYQQGNTITIPQREGYEIKTTKDILPKKHTIINDPEYGEIPFETYLELFPYDYFYVRPEENDPELLIIEPTSSPHRMSWFRVPYYDLFKFALGYNYNDALRRNNILSGSLYRLGGPDPIDNTLNNALTGVTSLARYGLKEATKLAGKLAIKGLNTLGKALTPSTWVASMFGNGYYATLAGLGLDATTFGSLAYGSVKDMIDNGANIENILGTTMSVPAVASAYNIYKTAKTGKNLYNLISAMNKALEDPEMGLYLYNRASNTDFLPTVYEGGIKPLFNATTTVKTNLGVVSYDPDHLQKHFEQNITPLFIKNLVENSKSKNVTGRIYNLSDLKGKNNINLTYPNVENTNFIPSRVEVPEQFPHINFSFSNDLEDYSFLGYPAFDRNYNTIRVGDKTINVPKPLQRVVHAADVDPGPYPVRMYFTGNPYEIEKEIRDFRKYTYLNENNMPDFVLRTAYPVNKLASTGVNNIGDVYSSIEVPTYLLLANKFPDAVWNPVNGIPSNKSVNELWWDAVLYVLDDVMSPEYALHISKELGYRVNPVDVRRTLIRRYSGTIPYERSLPYGEFPISRVGKFTFLGLSGDEAEEAGLSFFEYLKKNKKINPNYANEEEFLASLSEDEKLAYKYAKEGERKMLGVELPGGLYGSLFDTPLEEAYHVQDIGNKYTPWMRSVDTHNEGFLKYLTPIISELGGKEALPRFRWALGIYRDLASDLENFYVGKSKFEIPRLFYRDFLNQDSKLYEAFPILKEEAKKRFFFELKHGFKNNKAFFDAMEHIVYNDNSKQTDLSMA